MEIREMKIDLHEQSTHDAVAYDTHRVDGEVIRPRESGNNFRIQHRWIRFS